MPFGADMPRYNQKELYIGFRQALVEGDCSKILWYLERDSWTFTESDEFMSEILNALELIGNSLGAERRSAIENFLLEPTIINGNLALVEYLCARPSIRIDTIPGRERSALDVAVLVDNIEVILLLLNTAYDLEKDPARTVFNSRALALEKEHHSCLCFLNTACLYQYIGYGDTPAIQILLQGNNYDPFFKNAHEDTPLHCAIANVNDDILNLILSTFSHALILKNKDGDTPIDIINRLMTNPDIKKHFELNYKRVLIYILEKILLLDENISSQIDVDKNMYELTCIMPILRQLTEPSADLVKGALVSRCHSPTVVNLLLTSANIQIGSIPESAIKTRLQLQQQSFIVALARDSLEEIQLFIQQGVNPNFYLENGETPLTMAINMHRADWVSILMRSPSIVPHLANLNHQTPAYLAFMGKDVPCFATVMMDTKTPICETRPHEIYFPGMGWVAIDLDNNDQVEMWEGLSRSNFMEKKYNIERKAVFMDRADLKDYLCRLTYYLQSDYSSARQLLLGAMDTNPIRQMEGYFLTRHRQTAFLDDPDKRGHRECQSAVLCLTGYPTSVFTHEVASKRGASIAYFVDPTKCLTTTKGDMDSVKLWQAPGVDPSIRQFDINPDMAIDILDRRRLRPGGSVVRHRLRGEYKQRAFHDLVKKIKQMSERALFPYYLSTKDIRKHGVKGGARVKVNENHLFYMENQTLPYNEVLLKTAAMESGPDAVSDISHIYLTENKGNISVLALLVAVSTQMELMLHRESKRYFPICYYNAVNGTHLKISITGLSFLTKLAEICRLMPIDCLRFDIGLKAVIRPMSIEEFFLTEQSAESIRALLLSMCSSKYHSDLNLIAILEGGCGPHQPLKDNIYLPYVSDNYNKDVNRVTKTFNMGRKQIIDSIAETVVQQGVVSRSSRFFSPAQIINEFSQIRQAIFSQFWPTTIYRCSTISKDAHVVVKELPTLTTWRQFWLEAKEMSIPQSYMWNLLSVYIINCPYEDNPFDFQETSLGVVYRLNHDVSHAIRKFVLVTSIFSMISQFGYDEIKETLANVTKEEYWLLALVAFLERCGRTNEEEGAADPSNAIRSMEIIREVVTALGFNQRLIASICSNAVNYTNKYEEDGFLGKEGDPGFRRKKAELFNLVLRISHHCDLGRCRGNGVEFIRGLFMTRSADGILHRLVPRENIAVISEWLIGLVLRLSRDTGTNVRGYGVDFYNIELKAHCVYDTHKMMEQLMFTASEHLLSITKSKTDDPRPMQ